jgi:hypothetical protein
MRNISSTPIAGRLHAWLPGFHARLLPSLRHAPARLPVPRLPFPAQVGSGPIHPASADVRS